jgi:hypothetical protein
VPAEVTHIIGEMSGYPAPWALGGGWAVDAWIGETTRDHGDVDVIVFADDHQAVFEHLTGWQLAHHPNQPDDGNAPWDGRRLAYPDHLHGRLQRGEEVPAGGALWPDQGWHLDVQFNERDGDDWILSQDPLLTLPIARTARESPLGAPTIVPEVLLFYKAIDMRPRDKQDFERLLPLLSDEGRAWLRDALARVGHPWLQRLST